MLFWGEHTAKLSKTGQMTLPRKFLSMVYGEATHSEATLILARSPDRNVSEIEHPYIVEGWRSMEDYQAEMKNYLVQFPCLAPSDPMFDFVHGHAELFEVRISAEGKIALPEPMRDFMRVNGKVETMYINGIGPTFEMMSEMVNKEDAVAMQKWLDDLRKRGINDPLERLPY